MMAEGSRQRHSEQPYSDSIEMKAPATVTMMSDSKGTESVSVDSVSWEGHGEQDKRDMERLGKTQEFKRNFGFWSALGFVGELAISIVRLRATLSDSF